MPIDAISVSRIEHPSERFTVGMDIKAVIKSIENGRISLSHKELLGTWEENAENFAAGETVAGVIRSIESYGVFVELAPNLAGLAELREGSERELLSRVGQSAAVYIKSIVPERMKIKLAIIDAYCTEPTARRLTYYIDPKTTRHLSRWRYSPANAQRVVETVFDE